MLLVEHSMHITAGMTQATTYGSITSSVGCTTTAYDSSLSSLADNGGYTMTMAASSSSTALNAGCWIGSYTSGSDTKYAYSTDGSTWYALEDGSSVSETVTQITTDQRGYYINSNVGISIGAYQYDGPGSQDRFCYVLDKPEYWERTFFYNDTKRSKRRKRHNLSGCNVNNVKQY